MTCIAALMNGDSFFIAALMNGDNFFTMLSTPFPNKKAKSEIWMEEETQWMVIITIWKKSLSNYEVISANEWW